MLVDRIIDKHLIDGVARPGEIVTVRVDRVYVQDGNSPTIARHFRERGFRSVFDKSRIGVFFDHSVIWPNQEIAARTREAEFFCSEFDLTVFRAGEGISHVVAMEQGWFEPGTIVLGSDSHTCTGGANQALALGMGATDIIAAMLTGETWLKCPETTVIHVVGRPSPLADAKDVMLYVLSRFPQERFLYRSVEWCGDWVSGLSGDEADTVANMAVEMGAKCAFLPPTAERPDLSPIHHDSVDDGVEVIEVDVTDLRPYIARPNSPSDAVPVDQCAGLPVNYVFVGTCTNGRLRDIAEASRVLKGAKVHPSVHFLVTPASKEVYLEALALGYIEDLTRAGAIITPPGCGACLGTQGSIPASGDRVVSTMNRNFLGRMGNREAEIFLASPLVAAYAAIQGRIPYCSDLMVSA